MAHTMSDKYRFCFLMIVILSMVSCKRFVEMEKIDDLTVLHLRGTAYDRGYVHGVTLHDEIQAIVERWKSEVKNAYKEDSDSVISRFFISTTYLDTIVKYCPQVLDEVRGIARGCGIEFQTVLAFQMSEEIAVLSDELQGRHCTSIGMVHSDSPSSFLGQNMDPPLFLHGNPVLLHYLKNGDVPESYIYTFPGFIGLTGLNANGIGVTCTSMSMLNHSRSGLPVSCILRTLLDQNCFQDACELMQRLPIAIPQCFTIGGIRDIKCFECSAHQKTEFYPFKDRKICLHTNFAVTNRDFNQHFIDVLAAYNKTVDDPYYCPRYFLAYDKIKDFNYKLNYDTIKCILSSSEPEMQPISNMYTYGCLIMQLTAKPKLYLAPGKPDSTDFVEFTF